MATTSGEPVWMLVDDDDNVRDLLMIMMRMWGVKPLSFRNGYEAQAWIEAVSSGRYHEPLPEVALIDIRMPGPPGHHIGYQMRQTEPTKHIPIVMMTAFLFDREEEAHIRAMVCPDRFLKKPLPSPEELRIMLQSTVKAARIQVHSASIT